MANPNTMNHRTHTAYSFSSFSKIQHFIMQWRIPPTRNSRLKHILRRSLPEPATAPPTSAPPALLPTSVARPAAPPPAPSPVTAAALSPMQYAIPPGFGLAKTGPRNASADRRKRNRKDG
ncbi:mediator of RNA polymerase II transcription subunit 31-like [Capsicum galapagoense]